MYKYKNMNDAYPVLIKKLLRESPDKNGMRSLQNITIVSMNPMQNIIDNDIRKMSMSYAKRELRWYESHSTSVLELQNYAPIWKRMHNGDGEVNSNYFYQINRNGQYDHVVDIIKKDPLTRRAWLTILDTKEHHKHKYDTPCTVGVGFNIRNNRINMTVCMRSNDVWYGFPYDQYMFSHLLKSMSIDTNYKIGKYTHFVIDFHLYPKQWKKIK